MRPVVYVETTVFSYLAARPSRDVVIAGHQRVTNDWWLGARADFELVASAVVVQEITAGDPDAATARASLLSGLPLLAVTEEAQLLAASLLRAGHLPPKANLDALHLAVAAVGRTDYLTTWNMRHLAGAVVRRRLEQALRAAGYEPPMLCTPEELLLPPIEGGAPHD
jgi:hypothetical protein